MNSFPLRRTDPVPHLLSTLAAALDAPEPETDVEVRGIAPLALAEPDEIGLVAGARYARSVGSSRAAALLVSRPLAGRVAADGRPRVVVEDAHRALGILLELFHPEEPAAPDVHPTAVLGRGVQLGRGAVVGPYAVVEAGSVVGEGSRIGAHAVVGAGSRIGSGSILHPHVVLYPGCVLGERVIVHAGAVLGADGFGYVFQDGEHRKVPQVGRCVVEDDVEIGANTTIDRGSIGVTRVGRGAKIDNLVHLGHNVVVGPRSILAGQVGVAGSAEVGAGVMVGGQAGIGGHLRVGDGARIAGQAGVTGDVAPRETVMGFPARPRAEYLRVAAAQTRLPGILARLRGLEAAPAGCPAEPAEGGDPPGDGAEG